MDAEPNRPGGALTRAFGPRWLLRACLLAAVGYYLVLPLARRVDSAFGELQVIDTRLAGVGFGLQVAALWCYSVMTRGALDAEPVRPSLLRLFRIQLATRAITTAVPGGAAAGPALGYRLLTDIGVSARGASVALASASLISALVLNVMLWFALVVSVPVYGFNWVYAIAALVGIVVMLAVGAVMASIIDGSALIERPVRFVASRLGRDPGDVAAALRGFGEQLDALRADRRLLIRLATWASANWLLDAMSLWVFLRAFGVAVNPVGLLVAFGVANVLAAIPISPGGVGIVEWAYIPILVTFGATLDQATIGVACYRVAQFLFPIVLGSVSLFSLHVERRLSVRRRAPA